MSLPTTSSNPTIPAYVHALTWGGPDVLIVDLRPLAVAEPTAEPDCVVDTQKTATRFPAFSAGSHIDLHLPVDGHVMVRQYSLINYDPEPHRYLIAVLRERGSRGGSQLVHETLRVGHVVEISAPRNTFPLAKAPAAEQRRHLLLGGGIGVTPLLSMAQFLATQGADYELHTYAATRRDAPLTEFIAEVLTTQPEKSPYAAAAARPQEAGTKETGARWCPHYSAESESFRDATALPWDYQPGDHVYICGPSGFIEYAFTLAAASGWPEHAVHLERFRRTEPAPLAGNAFAVVAQSTGQRMPVPEQRTIAEVLREHGYPVSLSCEQGICGSCLTGVLAGEPEHRDEVQSDAEQRANKQITVCCSRSHSAELVLDL